MGAARFSLQSFGKSGDVHFAFGRIILQARKDDAADRQIYSGREHNGATTGRKHEYAAGPVPAL